MIAKNSKKRKDTGFALPNRAETIARSHVQLSREAAARFPRQYVDNELHRADCAIIAQEAARDFLRAMSRRDGNYLDGSAVAAAINSEAPDDCRVVSADDYAELRTHAIALWKFVAEVSQAVDSVGKATGSAYDGDPLGRIMDALGGARRFTKDFRAAESAMPDIVTNNEF